MSWRACTAWRDRDCTAAIEVTTCPIRQRQDGDDAGQFLRSRCLRGQRQTSPTSEERLERRDRVATARLGERSCYIAVRI